MPPADELSPLLEQKTRESEFLRQLLDAAGEMIIATTVDGTVTYWNRTAADAYGWTAAEAVGRNVIDLTVPSVSAEHAAEIMAKVQSGEAWSGEFEVRRRDGSTFPAYVTDAPVLDNDGRVVGVIGVSRDITEQKLAAAAMAASEARWRSLAEAMPALVAHASGDGRLNYYNRRWERYTGVPVEEIAEHGWQMLLHPDDVARTTESWSTAVATATPAMGEYRLRRADGAYRWHLVFAEPVMTPDGEVESWVGAAIEVHDRHVLEDDLRAASEAKDEFLGLVSHELKTPITTILGNAELLWRWRDRIASEDQWQALKDIHDEAEHLSGIIDNMLILSRVEAGAVIETEPVRVERAAQEMAARHRARFPERRIEVTARDLPLAAAVPMYLEQILTNLLSNAEKYSPPDASIEVEGRREGDAIVVSVLDRGRGLAEDELNKIFSPFYRSPRTAEETPGMGIGLAVCKRLVEIQAGRLWAQARDGGGLTVSFALPLYSVTENSE